MVPLFLPHRSSGQLTPGAFPAEYPNRERFLATIHGADKGAAETAVRELGILFDVDLIGALVAIRSSAPPANLARVTAARHAYPFEVHPVST